MNYITNTPNVPPVMMEIDSFEHIIVFAPHADDESIGCGGAIAQLRNRGKKVTLVVVSDSSGAGGLDEGASERRADELRRAATVLDIDTEVIFWNLPDGGLHECEQLAETVLKIAHKHNGYCAFAPWIGDTHSDHRAVGEAVAYAHRQGCFAGGVWFYEVWSPLVATHILSISDVWETKKRALECHETALSCADYVRSVQGLNAYRSLLGTDMGKEGCYAEAFSHYLHVPSKENIVFRDVLASDGQDIAVLFEEVFETQLAPQWWSWKYEHRPVAGGVGVRDSGEVISFYGALERTMIIDCREWLVCQMGDVMVAPNLRGWGGRKGAFYHTSFAFLDRYVGDGKHFALGFGFPTPRALKLGVRLGLYIQADALQSWEAPAVSSALGFGVHYSSVDASTISSWEWVNPLESALNNLDTACVWMKKTPSYWQWRYGEHPSVSYRIVRVKMLSRLIGAVVLRERESSLEIVDIAFSHQKWVKTLLIAAQKTALRHTKTHISAWGTWRAIDSFNQLVNGDVHEAGYLTLPGKMLGSSLGHAALNRLWLLGGDTDFR